MKHKSSPLHRHFWTAEIIRIPSVQSGGAEVPLYLLFTVDNESGLVTGYDYFPRITSLSLVKVLSSAFHDHIPPDMVAADFIPGFEFDAFGSFGTRHCRVVRHCPASRHTCGAIERIVLQFRRFLYIHFRDESPLHAALLLLTDVFFEDFNTLDSLEREVSG